MTIAEGQAIDALHLLQEEFGAGCSCLSAEELSECPVLNASAGWEVPLAGLAIEHPTATSLQVIVDEQFPNSQPRVVARGCNQDQFWPHVESQGLLCLSTTRINANPGERIKQHVEWAIEVLSYDGNERRREFESEFSVYWSRNRTRNGPEVWSLVSLARPSQTVYWAKKPNAQHYIVADSISQGALWLSNSVFGWSNAEFHRSKLIWLGRPWSPDEFPTEGKEILEFLSIADRREILVGGLPILFLFAAETSGGATVVAATAKSRPVEKLRKGLPRGEEVPFERLVRSFGVSPVSRGEVTRVDPPWVHGRGIDPNVARLHNAKVAIVGCGSLGGYIARSLVQAGVGGIVLVDPDSMQTHNAARHVLGFSAFAKNKASALADVLRTDFPHLQMAHAIERAVAKLAEGDWNELETCDVVLSAGIDTEGLVQLDERLSSLETRPPHICCWVETYAIAGHAVCLTNHDQIKSAFDSQERIKFRVTDWPDNNTGMFVEAGCSNTFQPHGAVDLLPSVSNTVRLTLDVLLGLVKGSCRRVWHQGLERIEELGGTVRADTGASGEVQEYEWL